MRVPDGLVLTLYPSAAGEPADPDSMYITGTCAAGELTI